MKVRPLPLPIVFIFLFLFAACPMDEGNSEPGPVNLLRNGAFDDGFAHWGFFVNDIAAGSYEVTDKELRISITNVGEETYSIGIGQVGLEIRQDVIYCVSFDARTDAGHTMTFHSEVQQNSSPWTDYTQEYSVFTVTETQHSYSYIFKMNYPTESAAGLTFHLGQNHTGNIYFDNIVLQVVGE